MLRWLTALLFLPLLVGVAPASAQTKTTLLMIEETTPSRPRVDFRLVQDPLAAPGPIHNSGMIAHTELAPNTTLGVGLLKASPKKFGSGEWHPDSNAPRSRKAAVTLRLKF